ncbi:MAG: hypothetical protein ACYDHZ_00505 [Dehalococcoidia bacterium]
MDFKLGKLPPDPHRQVKLLHLENYLDVPKLPPLPEVCNNYRKLTKLTMEANDRLGCCVIAGAAHRVQSWTAMAAREQIIPEKTVVDTYLKLTGGADTGLCIQAFLDWLRKNEIAGHSFKVYAAINPKNKTSMRFATYLFGGAILGIELPKSIDGQDIWDVPEEGLSGDGAVGSLGGHCTDMASYASDKGYVTYTWGMLQPMTEEFVNTYCSEAYALLSLDFFTAAHRSPEGFYWRDLLSDLSKITG